MPIADLFPGLFAQFTRTAHFDEKTIAAVEKLVVNKNEKPYLKCLVRQKEVLAKPEEIIRQLWLTRSSTASNIHVANARS